MRKSSVFFIYMLVSIVLLCLIFIYSSARVDNGTRALQRKAEMAHALGLTDLCLFTEARYTRHPSMADLNTPFQDYPLSLEHFPSGSLINPPEHIHRQ